jgi:hypothetical protein
MRINETGETGDHISDSTPTKEEGEKICCPTFFCSHKYHKIVNYFMDEHVCKQFKQIHKELQYFLVFTQKIVTKLFKILVWYYFPDPQYFCRYITFYPQPQHRRKIVYCCLLFFLSKNGKGDGKA